MKPLLWYLDSGCSRHMIREEYMFQDLRPKKGRWVTFGGNYKVRIIILGRIGKHPFPSIDNVLYVKGLKYNLLSISQLCDNEYDVSFNKGEYIKHKNMYKIDLIDLTNQNVTCLKFGHGSSRLISKLNIVSTSRPLQLLHIDLFGPSKTALLGGNIMDW
ncbi:hypothetical protein CR513_56561, partial [Mucuna pruriens]